LNEECWNNGEVCCVGLRLAKTALIESLTIDFIINAYFETSPFKRRFSGANFAGNFIEHPWCDLGTQEEPAEARHRDL